MAWPEGICRFSEVNRWSVKQQQADLIQRQQDGSRDIKAGDEQRCCQTGPCRNQQEKPSIALAILARFQNPFNETLDVDISRRGDWAVRRWRVSRKTRKSGDVVLTSDAPEHTHVRIWEALMLMRDDG